MTCLQFETSLLTDTDFSHSVEGGGESMFDELDGHNSSVDDPSLRFRKRLITV